MLRQLLIITGILLVFSLQAQEVQWAKEVVGYSSQYGPKEYSAEQALGVPNALGARQSNHMAWVPRKEENLTGEYIRVRFSQPMRVQQIAIAESLNPGSIQRILLYDQRGKRYKVYENNSPQAILSPYRLFRHTFSRTDYEVYELKLELKTKAVKGSNQIDAIGIADFRQPIRIKVESMEYEEELAKPERLGNRVNSPFAERMPLISPDGQTLYFARKYHPQNIGNENQDDIWVAYRQADDTWSQAINIGAPLNTKEHNFVIGLSTTGDVLYLANDYRQRSKAGVSFSKQSGRTWSRPKSLDIANHYNDNEFVAYHMSVDSRILMMAVERDEGYGDRDIYVSFRQSDGDWTEPLNLGPTINTLGIESSVFLAADGQTIYFSSNGHKGYGGLDMFMSRRLDNTWTNWSTPKNLGEAINSTGNDYNYSIPASGEYAYFSSDDPQGMSDLYRIRLPRALRPEPVMLISGRIIDAETQQPLDARLQLQSLQMEANEQAKQLNTSQSRFQMVLPYGEDLGLYAEREGYFSVSESMELSGDILEELDGDQQSMLAQNNGFIDTPSRSSEVEKLQLRLNRLDDELRELEAERKRAQAEASQLRKKENNTNYRSYRSDPELDALKHRFEQITRQGKEDRKNREERLAQQSTSSASDGELSEMRRKFYKHYYDKEKEKQEKVAISEEREDEELNEMRRKLDRYRQRKEVADKEEPTVELVQAEVEESLDTEQPVVDIDFETLRKKVRVDLERELLREVRLELQNELIAEVALDLERYLDEETRDKLTNRFRNEMRRQLKAELKSELEQEWENEERETKKEQLEELADIELSLRRLMEEEVKSDLREELTEPVREYIRQEMIYRLKKKIERELQRELAQKMSEEEKRDEAITDFQPSAVEQNTVANRPITTEYQEVQQDILLVPIKEGQIIPMNNIFFDANQSTIKPASNKELERVLRFLNQYSGLVVEVGGHTNGWCSHSFAHDLSMDRSQAVATFFIDNGIPENRVQFRGYGKTKPIASNDSLAGRKKNQRVELKILEIKD